MDDHSMLAILQIDIPDSQQKLRDSHDNLYRVAEYCRKNYLQADDKRIALEETKDYATQALASVAYQINSFSSQLLQLFEHQDMHLADMEGQVRHIGETVMIHKEKIARREIGALATTNKSMHRQVKLLQPPNAERAIRYTRRPIDYSVYDDVGHGMKITQPQHNRNVRKSLSSVTDGTASISSATGGGGPNSTYDTGAIYRKTGTLNPSMTGTLTRSQGRNLGDYRTPVPPAPPVVPPVAPPNSNYGPALMSNGRQMATHTSPRLGQQSRGDHYRTGNMALPGYPITANTATTHHLHHQVVNPLSPPVYNPVPQQQPNNSQTYSQYGSRDEVFRYPVSAASQQPVRRLSNGSSNGATAYGALPLHHGHQQQQTPPSAGPPPPPPPPPPGPGESYNLRNGVVTNGGYPVTGNGNNGVKTPIRNSTMLAQMNSQTDSHHSPPLPPPPPTDTHQHHPKTGNGYLPHDEPHWIPKIYIEKVVAIYDYQADKDDELTFLENQIIYVIKKNDDGWFEGVMEGVRGLFPGNYVESCI